MGKYCLIFLITISNYSFAQQNLKNLRTKSWQTYAYKISAADAEKFRAWDSIPLNQFAFLKPNYVFDFNNFFEQEMGIGNFVVLSVIDNYINVSLINNSNIALLTINNKDKLQIDVRNKQGQYLLNAKVFVNNKQCTYNQTSQTYWVSKQKLEKAKVKIYTADDTLFSDLIIKDDLVRSIKNQKIRNFTYTKKYKILKFIPNIVKQIFKKNKKNNIGATGYIIFNQPKYKPFDTVKFKAYVVNKIWNQYNKNVDIFIDYYQKGKYIQQYIKTIQPASAGAYVSQFVLPDTLPLDTRYSLILKTKKGTKILANDFKIEEYVLDEVATYTFKSDKDDYYRADSFRFFASANDANGLPLLDGKATLVLTVQNIKQIYADTIFIKDTLYQTEVKLNTTTDTKFVLAANTLPKAYLNIKATLIFKNANNELQEKQKNITYNFLANEIRVTQFDDSLKAIYLENGFEKNVDGELEMDDDTAIAIKYPFACKLDPIIKDYTFWLKEGYYDFKTAEINNYKINITSISNKDTLGFCFYNPYKIPLYYSIFKGTKVMATAKSNDEFIKWQQYMKNPKQMYKVRWQYIWAGQEQCIEENIGIYFKKLQINATAKNVVYPGQEDSIYLSVVDYKNRPAKSVNLTAVSYNNQFKNSIKVKDPPYLVKYKSRGFLERKSFESATKIVSDKKYLLGNYQSWVNAFNLDTMPFYKFLLPKNGIHIAPFAIQNFVPEVSLNLVNKGVPQEIYLLYLNKQLVYFNGVTDKMKYSFSVYPGIVQIGIRTKDKYIELDSVYIQPNYKHDISIDINNLPTNAIVKNAKSYWSYAEMQLLENSILQMQNNNKHNNAWLWQGSAVVQLQGNRLHYTGPFVKDSIQFFNPNDFDIAFLFEHGYQYEITKNILRLEKIALFEKKDTNNILPTYAPAQLKLGDTLTAPPKINYLANLKKRFLILTNNYEHISYAPLQYNKGSIQYTKHKDTSILYTILMRADSNIAYVVGNNFNGTINNVEPNNYHLLLVTNYYKTAIIKNITVLPNGTLCANMERLPFLANNEYLNQLLIEADASLQPKALINVVDTNTKIQIDPPLKIIENGTASVLGVITDAKTNLPIPFCSIKLSGYNLALAGDAKGGFKIIGLTDKEYILIVAAVGYQTKLEKVNLIRGEIKEINIKLSFSNSSLQEVIVTGYSLERMKKSMGYSFSNLADKNSSDNISFNLLTALQGKVSGLNITSQNDGFFGDRKINLRGIQSLTNNNEPLYVVDGIVQRTFKITDINPNNIADIQTLNGINATNIYGADGVNGVILITTKNKTERKQFKDYALWEPNFFTDKNGKASIKITYPDNITGWNTFIIAMDKNRRIGKTSFITQAYKPIVAQLNLPTFLIEGDTSYFIGKAMNYTSDTYNVKTSFSINGFVKNSTQFNLNGNDANAIQLIATANNLDTITAKYSLVTTTNFKDGEVRKIPIFKKGLEEVKGNFWVLNADTTVQFKGLQQQAEIQIYTQNSTLDILLQEIELLKKYPFACMEQTVSKYTGLVLEQKIKAYLNKPFTNKKLMDMLLLKVQKAQLFNGGWPWWEGGTANFQITNYIVNALLNYRENLLVQNNIRNGFLYIQNQLPLLKTNQLLAALHTLSQGNHLLDYSSWLNKISFDSLTTHEQWQCVSIMKQQKMIYLQNLQKLIYKKQQTMLGATFWGMDIYSWYSNDVATTIVAYNVLKNEPDYQNILPKIIQYFIERKKNGHWSNTVESASILYTILPHILATHKNFNAPTTLSFIGDTTFTINQFPFSKIIKNSEIKNLSIKKTGTGFVYVTVFQKYFNTNPLEVSDNFIITTSFEKRGNKVLKINTGELVKMVIKVNVLKDAEYVILQAPIPAGCILANKNGYEDGVYKEFFKDKVTFFVDNLAKGIHTFEINLEPRYAGNYILNPAKIELMYYPTLFGQNEIKKIKLQQE